tara:strand:- start:3688 stop:4251 length:564 start_codon:yes stop_codon:yes gene_type:complete
MIYRKITFLFLSSLIISCGKTPTTSVNEITEVNTPIINNKIKGDRETNSKPDTGFIEESETEELIAIIDKVDIDTLVQHKSGDDISELETGSLFTINQGQGLCKVSRQNQEIPFFKCKQIDVDAIKKIRRPCFYKNKIYLHGSIIPIHPGIYRITPSGSVITLQPGQFYMCEDGELVKQTLPRDRIY